MDLSIIYRNTVYRVTVSTSATVGDIINHVESLQPFQKETIKLLYKGKIVKDSKDVLLTEYGITTGSKLFLQASLATDIHAVQNHPQYRIRDDFVQSTTDSSTSSSSSSSTSTLSSRPRMGGYGVQTYGFGSIKVLELPGKENSRALLNRIANDPGVKKLMEKRKFFVPELVEMYPGGSNGTKNVDPVCILGLNVNKGMAIHLRIRTDDLQGYIKYNTILKTVYHELAHNIISEHTGEFFALVSEFEREAESLDWTRSSGRTLSDSATVFRREHTNMNSSAVSNVPPAFEGGSGITGYGHSNGGTSAPPLPLSTRELLAQAASRRLPVSKPEATENAHHPHHAKNDYCPVCSSITSSSSSSSSSFSSSSLPNEMTTIGTGGYVSEVPPVLLGTVENEGTVVENMDNVEKDTLSPNPSAMEETMNNVDQPSETSVPHDETHSTNTVPPDTSTVTTVPPDTSADTTMDTEIYAAQEAVRLRSHRIKEYVLQILKDCDTVHYTYKEKTEALELLQSIIERALVVEGAWSSPNITIDTNDRNKYRRIRRNNAVFQRKTVGSKGAIDFLIACGFQSVTLPSDTSNTTGSSNNNNNSTTEEWLSLPTHRSVDIASLWLGKEILQQLLQDMKDKLSSTKE